jgi:selenocysteine lyase/cysteine desulfurase
VLGVAYKWLLGPYSMAFMWVAPEWREGRPLELNWITRAGSEDFARLVDYTDAFQPGARRYDVGEPSNFALLPTATEAMTQISEWDPAAIGAYAATLTGRVAARADELGLGLAPPPVRSPHLLGVRVAGGDPVRLARGLREAGVHVSVRGDAIRVSAHVFNTEADVDRLFDALPPLLP